MSIEIKQLSYSYADKKYALENINLRIEDGELVGFMGHTGCGKTTLIQLIAGLLVPTTGQILIDNQDINSRDFVKKKLRENVGIVFQYPEHQLFETTVEKDVAFGLKHSGLTAEQVQQRVRESLEQMGFSYEEIRRQAPLALSGGEKRRVAIAGVLVRKPQILIFDEPIAGLDANARESFLTMVERLHQKKLTIIMVSHDADSLCEYTDRIVVLQQGHVLCDAPPKEVFSDLDRANNWSIGAGTVRCLDGALTRKGFLPEGGHVKYRELLQDIVKSINDAPNKNSKGGENT